MTVEPKHCLPDLDGLEAAVRLLRTLPDQEAFLHSVVDLLGRWTACEAIGVRLARDGTFPYVVSQGLPAALVETATGPVRDIGSRAAQGSPWSGIAALGEAVLAGRIDGRGPWGTVGGSFVTGRASRFSAASAQAEGVPVDFGAVGLGHGFESVALVPLRAAGRCIGVLHLADRRAERLDREAVAALERLADGMALALSRQDAQASLAAAEARYRAMFYTNIAVKLLIDPDTGRIVEANPAACAFYGYSQEVLRTLSIWDLNVMGPEAIREEMRTAKEDGQRFFRFTHRLADGTLREVEVYSGPVAFPGRTLLFSIVHDVTDRVRAEQARERVEQMLRHDLRSPLAGIVGLSGHLLAAGLSPEQKEMAAVIRETAERLYGMVGRNLDLLAIEQGGFILSPAPVALSPLLARLGREKAADAASRGVAMQLAGPGLDLPGEGPTVPGESGLLAAMFANLLANALEASPTGAAVTVALQAENDEVRVAMHNQGAVPKDIRERFFTKYATSGKQGGTGLGAYLARSVARLHGGDIAMQTGEASGTTVTVRLPVAHPEALDQSA